MSSDCSASLSDSPEAAVAAVAPPKRKAATARLDGSGTARSVKRRASKACQSCRARKVRCNVTEYGGNAPCTNCRLDEVECIVSESRRKRKWGKDEESHVEPTDAALTSRNVTALAAHVAAHDPLDGMQHHQHHPLPQPSARRLSTSTVKKDEHVPHAIYQTHGPRLMLQDLKRRLSSSTQASQGGLPPLAFSPLSTDARHAHSSPSHTVLPPFIKPLPAKIGPEEIAYLEKKGALTIPSPTLRGELLRGYVDFVHPYMPLLDLHDFVMAMDRGDGSLGKLSLIVFQAVMFAGSAFADMRHLRLAGYTSRKEARRDLFQRTRLLYDFDYESDRVSLVQALLLLAYYYETPDDQKDTWHWMGVATSVAHTIGLHRNPEKTNMDPKSVKLWKRLWWATYMRDRLIALGMRRPTRIKSEDYDVPMLTLDDFDLTPIPDSVTSLPASSITGRDPDRLRDLAIMCIEKAKLCVCISHVLTKQYCVLNNSQGPLNDRTTMMLLPKKLDPETCEVKWCDDELQKWFADLAKEAKYSETVSGNASVDLHRALLHMIFYTTLSALHRPQVLPSGAPPSPAATIACAELLELSRRSVRRAANAITSIAAMLDANDLVKFLPTTGVTVLLPAIIIHLLDIKAPEEDTRKFSLRGFCQCMQVMGKLRDIYTAADYSTAFLEAAIRKAGINIPPVTGGSSLNGMIKYQRITTVEDLVEAGRRLDARTLTPPPDSAAARTSIDMSVVMDPSTKVTDDEVARRLETFLASTPPESDHMDDMLHAYQRPLVNGLDATATSDLFLTGIPLGGSLTDFDEGDFDSLLDLDAVGESAFTLDDGRAISLPGESGGFAMDIDWMQTMA